jgi:hypothetical protein
MNTQFRKRLIDFSLLFEIGKFALKEAAGAENVNIVNAI